MLLVRASDPAALKDKKGNPVIRPYTPISPSDHKGELVFLIKKYDTGNASKHIHDLKASHVLCLDIRSAPYDTVLRKERPLP